jgi:hypothetical protein
VLLSQNHQKATAARGVEFEYTRAREYHIGPLDVIVETGWPSGQAAKYKSSASMSAVRGCRTLAEERHARRLSAKV